MGPDISLVLVTFRSSVVAPDTVGSFRAEVVLVDQSEDAKEIARLQRLGPDKMLARPNRGYAAGVNAVLAEAGGAIVLVGNPVLAVGAATGMVEGVWFVESACD